MAIAGDVLAYGTTMQWNAPAKGWNAGASMYDTNFNRRQTIRLGAAVAHAQVGVMARNLSAATFDLAAVTLSVGVVKRLVP